MGKTIVLIGSAGRTYQSIPTAVLERLGFIVVGDNPQLRRLLEAPVHELDELHELEAPPKGREYPKASSAPSGVAKARRAAAKRRRRTRGK